MFYFINFLIAVLLLTSCSDSNSSGNSGIKRPEPIAVVSKAIGDIKYKKKSDKELKETLKRGIDLHNNDYIKTGGNGFAKYTYIDDGTQIKVHNNSEIYIRGEINRRSIIKQLKVDKGVIKLEIKKQAVDEFTVITPTSVASVKGTSFWLDCSGKDGDKFYGESGLVSIKNKESGQITDLKENKIASSLPDGTLSIREMTPDELEMLEDIEEETGESGDSNEGDEEGEAEEKYQGGLNPEAIIRELKDKAENEEALPGLLPSAQSAAIASKAKGMLNQNSNKQVTDSGLEYIDIIIGKGESPKQGDAVVIHYTGRLEDGTKFDSSLNRGDPFSFTIGIGQAIRGWDEGIMSMKVGGKRTLIIPSNLGYGAKGEGKIIPPNATLIFEVELLEIKEN